jgi:hypothetical protein
MPAVSPDILSTALWLLSAVCIAVGLAGTLLPGLPGAPLVFGGLVLAAWADGFQNVGASTLLVLAVLTVLAFLMDFIAAGMGAKRAGASRKALIGAAIGTLMGLFFGLVGIFIGPFIGAAVGEYLSRRDLLQAGQVGVWTWIGFVFGTLVKLVLAFTMVGIFIIAYLL